MKNKLSYKSKKRIIVAIAALAVFATSATGTYMYIKGNNESEAADANQQVAVSDGENSNAVINNVVNNNINNVAPNGNDNNNVNPNGNNNNNVNPTGNNNNNVNPNGNNNNNVNPNGNNNNNVNLNGNNNNNNVNQNGNNNANNNIVNNPNNNGTTTQTTDNVPNTEFVAERVEKETVLSKETYTIEWSPLSINATTSTEDYNIVRSVITALKKSDDTVKAGDELTYSIVLTNSGNTVGKATVKDTIPEGTEFVQDSIKVAGVQTVYTAENLAKGIELEVAKESDLTLNFTVKVNSELQDGTIISNVASVNNKETNKTETEVQTTDIVASKSADNTVKIGESITYTITLTNNGSIPGIANVKDSIPEGTEYVENSIKVAGAQTIYTAEDLAKGIDVEVAGKSNVLVSFTVKVNEDLDNDTVISNTAIVNDNETNKTETTAQKAIISASKTAEKTVKAGENLTYAITVSNTGSISGKAIVKDTIPEGTTFVENSIKVANADTQYTAQDLANGLEVDVDGKSEITVKFTVNVNSELDDGTKISNVAVVNDTDTNSTETEAQKAIISAHKSVDMTKANVGDNLIYTITVTNSGSLAGVATVKDTIPEGTTFVENSIKVAGANTQYTDKDLANGIEVEVAKKSEVIVSFVVKVNNTTSNIITNKAIVNGVETEETTTEISTKYMVEHYLQNVANDEYTIDSDATETKQGVVGANTEAVVKTYTDFAAQPFSQETIKADGTTVIKIYYNRLSYNYIVKYYYQTLAGDWNYDANEDEKFSAKFGQIITTYPTDGKDKDGVYELSHATPSKNNNTEVELTITENSANNIISVYYKVNPNKTKEIMYTVQYYKDNVLVSADTQVEKKTVHVLEPDTLTVDKTKINTSNKYEGYIFDYTEPASIPNTVNNGAIIKIYYISTTYTVTYYDYNGSVLTSESNILKGAIKTTLENYTGTLPENSVFAAIWVDDNDNKYEAGSSFTVNSNKNFYPQFVKIPETESEARSFWNNKLEKWSNVVAQLTPVLINGNVEKQVFYCKDGTNGEINIKNNGAITKIIDKTTNKEINHDKIHLVTGHVYEFSINKHDVPSGKVIVTVK